MLRELPPTAGMPLSWRDLLNSGRLPSLEELLSGYLEVPEVQIECSGTASLVVALETLKTLSDRRTVIIPGYTCPLVAVAIGRAGLKVRVCDTQPDSFDFDPAALRNSCTEDTLCVVPTHLGGLSTDLHCALDAAGAVGAYVIEDAAQSLGATWRGKRLGTIGDIGIYSFSVGKGLTIYEGGALVARDPAVRAALRETSRRLIKNEPVLEAQRVVELIAYAGVYNPLGLSIIYGAELRHWLKQGNIERAVGDVFPLKPPLHKVGAYRKRVGAAAFERFEMWLAANQQRGRRRADELAVLPGLRILREPAETTGSWPFLQVLFDSQQGCAVALEKLWTAGLGVTKLFVHEISGYEYLRELVPAGVLKNATSLANRCLTVSNSEMLSDRDFHRILETIGKAALLSTR